MYVAVKGGEAAIDATHDLVAEERRGNPELPEVSAEQISEQMKLSCARAMNEGSLYDPRLAGLALKQAQGDNVEAAFLLRAYRTTLTRFGSSSPIDTSKMEIRRRISATYKDLPGGQILGPTYDYTHRLFDFALGETSNVAPVARQGEGVIERSMPRVPDILGADGMMELEAPPEGDPVDIRWRGPRCPAGRGSVGRRASA